VSECIASAAFDRDKSQSQPQRTFTLKIVGSGHPVNEVRVEKLREELDRWRTEREHVLAKLRAKQGSITTDPARS
jgi:hypothetical protein